MVLAGGGAGTIGFATARAMSGAGAEVALLDVAGGENAAEKKLGGAAFAIECDVTDRAAVRRAFDRVAAHFGGVDIVVSNAGTAATERRIGEVDDAVLRQSFEAQFLRPPTVAQNAVRIMSAQGTGGCLLFNVSKQAVNPGPDFGPYGVPSGDPGAGAPICPRIRNGRHSRQCGKRHRIRSGLLTPELVSARAIFTGRKSENRWD